jgi:mannose-1-phosphate guanylyltransferase
MSLIRTAFILGAGLGTRLGGLTARRPKPLIPVRNRPLICSAFDHLLGVGMERLVVNTFWQAHRYGEFFPAPSYGGAELLFRQEAPEVLETAGGIWNVRDLLRDEPFIVYNGDIFTDLPLEKAIWAHEEQGNEATLILRSKGGPLRVGFDVDGQCVTDIARPMDALGSPQFLFTGIYLLSPEFIRRIPPATKIGVVAIFREMLRSGVRIGGVVIDDGDWWDLGSREEYLGVHAHLAGGESGTAGWIDPSAEIGPGVKISGATAIGAGAKIGRGAILHDCLIWENAEVASGADLRRCIVTRGLVADGKRVDFDFA